MGNKLEEVIGQYVINDNATSDKILNYFGLDDSKIIEVIGESGSGKSFILRNMIQILNEKKIQFEFFLPRVFQYNHFKQVLKMITDISDQEYNDIISKSEKYDFAIRDFKEAISLISPSGEEELIRNIKILIEGSRAKLSGK